MARTLARRPLRVPCDRARYLESDAMHETGAKIFATKLKRQSFEEDLAKIVRHHLRCLHDLVELAIGKCNRAHKVGDGGCSGGGVRWRCLGAPCRAFSTPPFTIGFL